MGLITGAKGGRWSQIAWLHGNASKKRWMDFQIPGSKVLEYENQERPEKDFWRLCYFMYNIDLMASFFVIASCIAMQFMIGVSTYKLG